MEKKNQYGLHTSLLQLFYELLPNILCIQLKKLFIYSTLKPPTLY